MSKTKTIIDEQCGWESLTLDQKLEKLQEILFNANTEVHGGGGGGIEQKDPEGSQHRKTQS